MANPVPQKQLIQLPIRDQLVDVNRMMTNSWVRTLTSMFNAVVNSTYSLFFSQTADKTIANTTAETSIVGNGQGAMTIPAGLLYTGKVIKLTVVGKIATSGPISQTINVKLNGAALATNTASVTSSGDQQVITFWLLCRLSGSGGKIGGAGNIQTSSSPATMRALLPSADLTVDTTSNITVDVTNTFSVAGAGNTFTSFIVTMEQV